MHLRATVRDVTGLATHRLGGVAGAIASTVLPDPAAAEIVEQNDAFYLLRLDSDNKCIADTWHETIEAAKAQAHLEYRIEEHDWTAVEDD